MNELNIVLNDELYQNMNYYHVKNGPVILFLELVSEGNLSSDIFSHTFVKRRSESLKMTEKEYQKEIIKPFKPLFQHKYKKLTIWTTLGMNTGMSLLLLLAYLDQIQDHNTINIHVFDDRMKKLEDYQITSKGYYNIYQKVLLTQEKPREITINPIQIAIPYYLEYKKKNNCFLKFIRENITLDSQMLYIKFMGKFAEYHFNDQQFIQLLHQCKKEKAL